MSDESTRAIAEKWQLEKELRAGAQHKTVQDLPHVDTIREKLRARAKDEKADPADRAAAIEALRVMYRE